MVCTRALALYGAVVSSLAGSPRTGVLLLETQAEMSSAAKTSGKATSGAAVREHLPIGPESFGAWPEQESTYKEELDGVAWASNYDYQQVQVDGWEKRPDNVQSPAGGVRPAQFFDESESGFDSEWQTHYPQPALRGSGLRTGSWRLGADGKWYQEYLSSQTIGRTTVGKAAGWFDTSVQQYDSFGRVRLPNEGSVDRLDPEVWTERSVNTTLKCSEPGCAADTKLWVYDPAVENVKFCKFSLHLHPTDFDSQYSDERVEWLYLNDVTVSLDCFPMASGCNESAQNRMVPCVQDLSIDNVIGEDGTMNVSAKIAGVVDECPYEGNYLHAVPMVTCMVSAIEDPPVEDLPPVPAYPDVPSVAQFVHRTGVLQCMERGCTASASFSLNQSSVSFESCRLRLSVFQTDFDQEDGTRELIEYIQVDNKTIVTDFHPGRNPCREEWAGISPVDDPLLVIEDERLAAFDVTEDALDGLVEVEMKISDFVDECAYMGYLLNGIVELNCTVAPPLDFD